MFFFQRGSENERTTGKQRFPEGDCTGDEHAEGRQVERYEFGEGEAVVAGSAGGEAGGDGRASGGRGGAEEVGWGCCVGFQGDGLRKL